MLTKKIKYFQNLIKFLFMENYESKNFDYDLEVILYRQIILRPNSKIFYNSTQIQLFHLPKFGTSNLLYRNVLILQVKFGFLWKPVLPIFEITKLFNIYLQIDYKFFK